MTFEEAVAAANDGTVKFRVWWVPQVPMKAFRQEVPTYAEGLRLCDALGRYDLFQYENRVKGDYANAGGVEFNHATLTNGEWHGVEDHEAEDFGWVSPDTIAKALGEGQ